MTLIICFLASSRPGKDVESVESIDFGRRFVLGLYKRCACSGGIRVHDLIPQMEVDQECDMQTS